MMRCLFLLSLVLLLSAPALADDPGLSAGAAPPVSAPKKADKVADRTSVDQLKKQPVNLTADQLSRDEQRGFYLAEGNVELTSGHLTLLADRVRYRQEDELAEAEGTVKVSAPEGVLSGAKLTWNLADQTGQLERGRVFLRQNNFHIAGDLIEKTDVKTYRIDRGTFTSCDGDDPDWHFSARDLTVTVDGYARGKHALFYVRKVPVLYSPYVLFPVKRGRETGLLMGSAGYSERRGTQVSVPFYWAIARNQDATFYLDWLSELGLGKGVEYRYIFGRDQAGEARYYHISGVSGAADRYALSWDHDGTFGRGWRFTSDSEYVSSRDYWEDFGEVAGEYNKDKVDSTLTLGNSWRRVVLTGQLRYSKNLEADNDSTLQRLPEVRLDLLRQRIGASDFSLELGSSATYFWRREGLTGQRLRLRPALSADFHPGDLVDIQPEIGFTERLYHTSSEGPGEEELGMFDFSTRISTRLARVFDVGRGRLERLRHSLQPEITYEFVPNRDQSSLPEFDSLDRVDAVNRISYGLTQRLTGRLAGDDDQISYREYLYLRLSQEYDIRESRRGLLDPADERQPFSSLRAELTARPWPKSRFDLDMRYDPDAGGRRFSTFDAGLELEDRRGDSLDIEYRYARNQREYLDARFGLDLLRPLYLDYRHRFDLRDSEELEKVLELEYRSQCWSLYLTLRDREDDRSFMVTFELAGLGRVGRIGGSLGSR
ncbi:MAG: LPS-assembly protein LptD [Deltaproteobacteria bacterium]|nr:MAG: LPS-assembly protein LptD [Deltaproteobacteria bacterium]